MEGAHWARIGSIGARIDVVPEWSDSASDDTRSAGSVPVRRTGKFSVHGDVQEILTGAPVNREVAGE
jgi:hypothetical protein